MKIFISGSIIKKDGLPKQVLDLIDSIIKEGADIIIGDSFGIDELVQEYLNSVGYRNVTVYSLASKNKGCNNIGNWGEKRYQVECIHNNSGNFN